MTEYGHRYDIRRTESGWVAQNYHSGHETTLLEAPGDHLQLFESSRSRVPMMSACWSTQKQVWTVQTSHGQKLAKLNALGDPGCGLQDCDMAIDLCDDDKSLLLCMEGDHISFSLSDGAMPIASLTTYSSNQNLHLQCHHLEGFPLLFILAVLVTMDGSRAPAQGHKHTLEILVEGLLKGCDDQVVSVASGAARRHTYLKDECLFDGKVKKDVIHLILSGKVDVIGFGEDGTQKDLGVWCPGDVIGDWGLIPSPTNIELVSAQTRVHTLSLTRIDALEDLPLVVDSVRKYLADNAQARATRQDPHASFQASVQASRQGSPTPSPRFVETVSHGHPSLFQLSQMSSPKSSHLSPTTSPSARSQSSPKVASLSPQSLQKVGLSSSGYSVTGQSYKSPSKIFGTTTPSMRASPARSPSRTGLSAEPSISMTASPAIKQSPKTPEPTPEAWEQTRPTPVGENPQNMDFHVDAEDARSWIAALGDTSVVLSERVSRPQGVSPLVRLSESKHGREWMLVISKQKIYVLEPGRRIMWANPYRAIQEIYTDAADPTVIVIVPYQSGGEPVAFLTDKPTLILKALTSCYLRSQQCPLPVHTAHGVDSRAAAIMAKHCPRGDDSTYSAPNPDPDFLSQMQQQIPPQIPPHTRRPADDLFDARPFSASSPAYQPPPNANPLRQPSPAPQDYETNKAQPFPFPRSLPPTTKPLLSERRSSSVSATATLTNWFETRPSCHTEFQQPQPSLQSQSGVVPQAPAYNNPLPSPPLEGGYLGLPTQGSVSEAPAFSMALPDHNGWHEGPGSSRELTVSHYDTSANHEGAKHLIGWMLHPQQLAKSLTMLSRMTPHGHEEHVARALLGFSESRGYLMTLLRRALESGVTTWMTVPECSLRDANPLLRALMDNFYGRHGDAFFHFMAEQVHDPHHKQAPFVGQSFAGPLTDRSIDEWCKRILRRIYSHLQKNPIPLALKAFATCCVELSNHHEFPPAFILGCFFLFEILDKALGMEVAEGGDHSTHDHSGIDLDSDAPPPALTLVAEGKYRLCEILSRTWQAMLDGAQDSPADPDEKMLFGSVMDIGKLVHQGMSPWKAIHEHEGWGNMDMEAWHLQSDFEVPTIEDVNLGSAMMEVTDRDMAILHPIRDCILGGGVFNMVLSIWPLMTPMMFHSFPPPTPLAPHQHPAATSPTRAYTPEALLRSRTHSTVSARSRAVSIMSARSEDARSQDEQSTVSRATRSRQGTARSTASVRSIKSEASAAESTSTKAKSASVISKADSINSRAQSVGSRAGSVKSRAQSVKSRVSIQSRASAAASEASGESASAQSGQDEPYYQDFTDSDAPIAPIHNPRSRPGTVGPVEGSAAWDALANFSDDSFAGNSLASTATLDPSMLPRHSRATSFASTATLDPSMFPRHSRATSVASTATIDPADFRHRSVSQLSAASGVSYASTATLDLSDLPRDLLDVTAKDSTLIHSGSVAMAAAAAAIPNAQSRIVPKPQPPQPYYQDFSDDDDESGSNYSTSTVASMPEALQQALNK